MDEDTKKLTYDSANNWAWGCLQHIAEYYKLPLPTDYDFSKIFQEKTELEEIKEELKDNIDKTEL